MNCLATSSIQLVGAQRKKTVHEKIAQGEEAKECLWANLTKGPSAYLQIAFTWLPPCGFQLSPLILK